MYLSGTCHQNTQIPKASRAVLCVLCSTAPHEIFRGIDEEVEEGNYIRTFKRMRETEKHDSRKYSKIM